MLKINICVLKLNIDNLTTKIHIINLPFLPIILVQKFAGNTPTWPLLGTMHFSMYVDIAGLNGSSQSALLPFKDEHLKQLIHDVPKIIYMYIIIKLIEIYLDLEILYIWQYIFDKIFQ